MPFKKKSWLTLYPKKNMKKRKRTLSPKKSPKRICLVLTPRRVVVTRGRIVMTPRRVVTPFRYTKRDDKPWSPNENTKRLCLVSTPKRYIHRSPVIRSMVFPYKTNKLECNSRLSTKKKLQFDNIGNETIDNTVYYDEEASETTAKRDCEINQLDSSEEYNIVKETLCSDIESDSENAELQLQNEYETASGQDKTVLSEATELLKELVEKGKYSTNSISFQLFYDTLKWHSSQNTSGMRYSEASKEFFWTGKRLLGGQFLRFMRGFAHHGQVNEHTSERGRYDPTTSQINLPVPSDTTLKEFSPSGIIFEAQKPGIIESTIAATADAMSHVSHVVMFDGKKIVPNSADIYLLDQEDEPKMSKLDTEQNDRLKQLQEFLNFIESVNEKGLTEICKIEKTLASNIIENSKGIIRMLSSVIQLLRECYCKKAVYLQSLTKKNEESNDASLKNAINRIKTLMYQIKICKKDMLEVINIICQLCSEINSCTSLFRNQACDLSKHPRYRELKNPDEVKQICNGDLPERYMKQRSPEWFQHRKTVKVTGSSAHRAIGLDTLVSQKKFFENVFCEGIDQPQPTEEQQRAMDHGSINEVNAIATLISKFMPVYYPEYTFVEEGAYTLKNENGEKLLIVSPDGSLRNLHTGGTINNIISIELKCPCPQYVGSTPVYYKVQPRHIVQNNLEAAVLTATDHIYASWSVDSTTVFRMKPNQDLVKDVLKEVKRVYYGEYAMRPSKVSETVKDIKVRVLHERDKAEFLGEFPSVMAQSGSRNNTAKQSDSVFYDQEKCDAPPKPTITLDIVEQNLHKGIKLLSEAFRFLKPMASEVLIYLLSDMDRTWNNEIGHGLPITYLFKGYSLPMGTSRRVLEEVLNACYRNGLHVPCVSFDGQFARLKDFDESDQPLTLFALQRQLWSKVLKMSKKQIVDRISELYQNPNVYICTETHTDNNGILITDHRYIVIEGNDPMIKPITTSRAQLTKVDKQSNAETSERGIETADTAGLDEDVLDVLEQIPTHLNVAETSLEDTLNAVSPHDDSSTDQITEHSVPVRSETNSQYNDQTIAMYSLEYADYIQIQKMLQDTKRDKWKDIDPEKLQDILRDAKTMGKELVVQELNVVIKYLNLKLKSCNVCIKPNLRKSEKINEICRRTGTNSYIPVPERRKRQQKMKSLQALCIAQLQKKGYPKEALAISYAKSYWLRHKADWFENATISEEVEIEFESEKNDIRTFKPVYAPEYSSKRQQLEVRVQDGTHIRTNIKSRLIKNGLTDVDINAWKIVAKSGKTEMVPALLEIREDGKIMHQQSDPFVRTMFSKSVETEIRNNGNSQSADFCKVFREWHEAEDLPGLSAKSRVERSLRLREWLLHKYNFSQFPPPSMYVRGIPRTTYEGLVCSIDAHILLYGLVKGGSFNWRSVSTLVAENFMGELAERSQNNNGVPSGHTLPADMTKISQLHAMRLNPNRSFQMKTSKSRSYEVPRDLNSQEPITETSAHPFTINTDKKLSKVIVKDHEFDFRVGSKPKHGSISTWKDRPRGVQSVRQHYKVDESKILPSLRLGITDDQLEELV